MRKANHTWSEMLNYSGIITYIYLYTISIVTSSCFFVCNPGECILYTGKTAFYGLWYSSICLTLLLNYRKTLGNNDPLWHYQAFLLNHVVIYLSGK